MQPIQIQIQKTTTNTKTNTKTSTKTNTKTISKKYKLCSALANTVFTHEMHLSTKVRLFKDKFNADQIQEKALQIGCHAGVTMVDLAGVQSNDHPQSHTDPRQ